MPEGGGGGRYAGVCMCVCRQRPPLTASRLKAWMPLSSASLSSLSARMRRSSCRGGGGGGAGAAWCRRGWEGGRGARREMKRGSDGQHPLVSEGAAKGCPARAEGAHLAVERHRGGGALAALAALAGSGGVLGRQRHRCRRRLDGPCPGVQGLDGGQQRPQGQLPQPLRPTRQPQAGLVGTSC
jgi:hypothetical protein